MRGHQEVIDQRLREKRKPTAIFFHDCDLEDGAFVCEHNMPSVSIAGDAVEFLDLRFVRGCQVHAILHEERRARALFSRLIQFKPHTCIVCVTHERSLDPAGALWMGIYTEEQGIQNG